MSLQQMDNHKFSGLIKVNISHDTNERQLIVNENTLRVPVNSDVAKSSSNDTNKRKSPLKIVRIIGEPMVAAKKQKCDIENGENDTGCAYEMDSIEDEHPSPDKIQSKKKYRLPDFVAGNLRAPKKNAPERLGIETIFPNVCFHFLNGRCIDGADCLYSHKYPEQKDVYTKLQAIGWENAAKLFRAIVSRCRGLLINYFLVFARYFASKRQRGPLLDMLAVCEDPHNKIVEYLGKLMKAFVFSGLSYSQSVALVLKNHRRITNLTLSIIFSTDIVSDLSVNDILKGLDLLNNDQEFCFDIVTINYLLARCCEIGTIAFVSTMIKIFDRLKSRCPSIMRGIDQNEFKKFMDIYENCMKQVPKTSGRPRICAP